MLCKVTSVPWISGDVREDRKDKLIWEFENYVGNGIEQISMSVTLESR